MDSGTISLIISFIVVLVTVLNYFRGRRESKTNVKNLEKQTEGFTQKMANEATAANTALFHQLQTERAEHEKVLQEINVKHEEGMAAISNQYESTLQRVNRDLESMREDWRKDRDMFALSLTESASGRLAAEREADKYKKAFVDNITIIDDLKQKLEGVGNKVEQHDVTLKKITGPLPAREDLKRN